LIETLIITLREGIEIALVLGILIVYLRKTGRPSLTVTVYTGLGLSVLASIAGAVILGRLAIDEESIEGFIMLIAAAFVSSMVVWMWMTSRKIRSDIEQKVDSLLQNKSSWRAHLSILLFTFIMITREGIETVMFLQAVAFHADALLSIAGTIIGVTLASVFAVLFIRGSVKIDTGRFLKVTAITLLIFVVQLIINAFHEFYENGVLPASPRMMGILGPIVQNDVFFVVAIISIPAVMLVVPGRKATRDGAPGVHRRWQAGAALAALVIALFLGVGKIYSSNPEINLSSVHLTVPSSGIIQIPTAGVADGNLHRYAIDDKGVEIRFFVLRTGMGKFATAFDACRACYSYGRYYLRHGQLICSQCEAETEISKLHPTVQEEEVDESGGISMEGNGCAPIYLPSRISGGDINIRLADLQQDRKYFEIDEGDK